MTWRAHLSRAIAIAALGVVLPACGATPSAPTPRVAAPSATPVAPSPPPTPLPPAPPARRVLGAVAAETQAATAIGAAILERGGTAVDAAVAMAFVSAVVQPSSCGLGGGGFAVVWDPTTRRATVVDFREVAPGGLRLRDHLGNTPPWARRGVLVGVPGFVPGLAAIHASGGVLRWNEVVADAVRLADEGFVVEPWLATTLRWSENALRREPGASFLLPGGAPPTAGDTLKIPALATTLQAIARGEGIPVGDVVARARAAGSTMVAADVAAYAPARREPLRIPFAGHDVLLPPPPSGGAVTIAQQLIAFPAEDVRSLDAADAVHLGAEGMRASIAERRQWVGDPAFTRVDLELLLDPSRLGALRRRLPRTGVTPPSGPPIEDGGTCQVVAWDADDRVVSLTSTLGGMFGAKIVTEGGFFLNDALGDFAHDPTGRRAISRGPNFARAGARPASSMAPAIVVVDGAPVLALGASGGARIPAAELQVLQRLLAQGEPLERAIDAPRWHAPSAGGLEIEDGLAPLAPSLRERGEALDEPRPSFAAVTAVRATRGEGGRALEAAADPRKGGAATIVLR